MATEYLDKTGLQKLVQLIQAMPDDATLEFVDGKLQVKSPLPIQNGGTGADTTDGVLTNLGIEDRVIAQGMSGVWYYRKYENGYAEAYTGVDDTGEFSDWAFDKQWGYTYVAIPSSSNEYKATSEVALPFPFVEVYDWGITVANGNNSTSGYGVVTGQYSSTVSNITMFPAFFLCRQSVDNTATNLRVRRYIRGRWK